MRALVFAWALCLPCAFASRAEGPPRWKVFLLVGQSNMEGKGRVEHLAQLAQAPETAQKYAHLLAADGGWARRDDAWIHYLDRRGPLTVGYGSQADFFGPELQFGNVVADRFDEPVLLIKIAWGGRSLGADFRPPSSGGAVGPSYTETIRRAKAVLADLKQTFPEVEAEGYELAGCVWFQGWNDRINQAFVDEYEANLANLIHDLRKDLAAPDLPFVIGETGQGGPDEEHPRALALQKAQAAVAQRAELRKTVRFVATRDYWAQEPSFDGGYHWFGNAANFFDIGDAFGRGMLALL